MPVMRMRVRLLTGVMMVTIVALTIVFYARAPIAAFQAPPNLLAHWRLDELDGALTVADASTHGNNGTVVDPLKWTDGALGGALQFDGSSDYVHVPAPTPSSLRQPSTGYAIAAWVKVSSTGPKGGDVATMGDNYALRIQPNGNVKTFFYSTTWHSHTTTDVNVIDGKWHHIVGQYDGTNLTVYVNGDPKGATAYAGLSIVYARGPDFYLGKHGNGGIEHTFGGLIDQVRVYDHALSPTDIARLAAEPPVAHWKLDEADGITVAQDSSISGFAGTVSDAQAWTTSGRVDGALSFNGSSYMIVANPPATPAARSLKPQREYAISAWVWVDATGPNGAEIATMGDNYGLRIGPTGLVRTFFHNGSTWRSHPGAGDVLQTNQWHHVVGQFDGTTLEVYVDGVRTDGPDYPGETIDYAGRGPSFMLGQHGNGSALYNLTGKVDQVRVFARALTSAEVAALAEEGGPPTEPPTEVPFRVLTWNLRKCKNTGNQTKDCVRIAHDIERLQPDVVLLSAVETEADASVIASTLGWPAPYYRKADDPQTNEGQAIISRFPMDDENDQYPPLVEQVTSSHTLEDQVIIRATLTIGGRKVHFFAIDQDHASPQARTEQANYARAWAWSFKGDGLPMIVGGDFNMESGEGINEWLTPPNPNVLQEAFFDDWTRPGTTITPNTPNGRTKRFRLDHILSYANNTGLVTEAAMTSFFFFDGTTCLDVTVTLCKPDRGECTDACHGGWDPEDTRVRASDHAILTVDFRLPSGS